MTSVSVFIDYENTRSGVRELFGCRRPATRYLRVRAGARRHRLHRRAVAVRSLTQAHESAGTRCRQSTGWPLPDVTPDTSPRCGGTVGELAAV